MLILRGARPDIDLRHWSLSSACRGSPSGLDRPAGSQGCSHSRFLAERLDQVNLAPSFVLYITVALVDRTDYLVREWLACTCATDSINGSRSSQSPSQPSLMGSFIWFLFVYVFGGLTFIPLALGLLLLYAHYTFPVADTTGPSQTNDPANIVQTDDEKLVLKTGTDDLAEQFHRKHESDVAAGYFAVCREYVPGGVQGKPPDKLSPAGEVVAQESPSVYQSMYRSIFDRQQKRTIEPNKDTNGKLLKRANNVFYVVLRYVAPRLAPPAAF